MEATKRERPENLERPERLERPEHLDNLDSLDNLHQIDIRRGISTAGDDEWEDLKTGTDQIWGDFTAMLGNAVKKIK